MFGPEVLVPLGFFAMIYGLVYLGVRRKERTALIEHDKDAKIFNMESNTSLSLKYALLLIGLALGSLIGNILEVTTEINDSVAYFSMILFFGGLGLIIFYLIKKKKIKE